MFALTHTIAGRSFCTGQNERKTKNLARNPRCVLTTGCNALHDEGIDVVVEGDAVRVSDTPRLERVAAAYESKDGSDWRFAVRDGAFHGGAGNVALVYEVTPATAFGFGRGTSFSQTRWRFSCGESEICESTLGHVRETVRGRQGREEPAPDRASRPGPRGLSWCHPVSLRRNERVPAICSGWQQRRALSHRRTRVP